MKRHGSKRIHMIGIGGAGMSPLAQWLVDLGYRVTGSDRQRSAGSMYCETLGIAVQYDHTPLLEKDADLIVYSSAIRPDNPEREYGARHGIRQIRRADMLGDLMRAHTAVCVCGTHGKTTTTSLIGTILKEAELDPTVLVGGILNESGAHAIIGHCNLVVAEADEFDRSFLAMYPTIAVITNIDADHLDCYRNLDEIKEAFIAFAKKVPFFGEVIACVDDPGVREVLPSLEANVTTYGIDAEADYRAGNIAFSEGFARFDVIERGMKIGRAMLSIPGMHNVRNALAAAAAARLFEVDFSIIERTFSAFRGVRRRFEVVTKVNDNTIVDDYAHHPRELQATIEAARTCGAARVLAVFQPHLYSRTRDFLDDFAAALMAAEAAYVLDIYCAREEPMPGVSARAIVDRMINLGHRDAHYVSERAELIKLLPPKLKKGDYILFMGAGDINKSAYALAEVLGAET